MFRSTFEFTSIICEGIIFLIMGIVVYQGEWSSQLSESDNQERMTHSYIFAACVLVILILGRIINVLVITGLGRLIGGSKFRINKDEAIILIVSGLVKGVVPFVLFTGVKFGENSEYGKEEGLVLKTTIIIVVVLSSILLNSLIPKIYKRRLKRLSKHIKAEVIDENDSALRNTSKKVSLFKKIEDKYIKEFLIFDYLKRLEEIRAIKLRNRHQSFKETLRQLEQEGHFDDPLPEDQREAMEQLRKKLLDDATVPQLNKSELSQGDELFKKPLNSSETEINRHLSVNFED